MLVSQFLRQRELKKKGEEAVLREREIEEARERKLRSEDYRLVLYVILN